ncbi:MAG: hypothetical protein IJS99_09990 [Synergistaceae bacterium]|nr:hypothetical protein [Synergistaceae bacterium]
MAHILKRKINNVIYIYQEKSYRDKLGRPRTKQKCLGKLDSKGVLILSRKINPENLPGTITQYIIITKKFRIKAITDTRKENKQVKPQSLTKPHKTANISRTIHVNSHRPQKFFIASINRPSLQYFCNFPRLIPMKS